MALVASRNSLKRLFNGFAAPAVAEALPALATNLRGFAAHAQPAEGMFYLLALFVQITCALYVVCTHIWYTLSNGLYSAIFKNPVVES